ncbi:hypothetical protein AVEN_90831-1 [Araneus ventricosus]|uniref:Uncharacterized protein n=1 Tax=Araneus ventricosus TaxID=182803 RepID=A0A4Y2QEG7_ARAVE|nr:hypothetical protein AVEN_90831-1 [Araneus ventricosus]
MAQYNTKDKFPPPIEPRKPSNTLGVDEMKQYQLPPGRIFHMQTFPEKSPLFLSSSDFPCTTHHRREKQSETNIPSLSTSILNYKPAGGHGLNQQNRCNR